jgi:cyclopropane-fatty-acyl-phospholipid synthase
MKQTTARAVVLALARKLMAGELTVVEDGSPTHVLGPGGPPSGVIEVRSPDAWPRMLRGLHGCVDAFRDGLWDAPDLTATLRVAACNLTAFDPIRRRLATVRGPWIRARTAFTRNTPERSRTDIAAHYDLGNELFSLMLDPTMTYSCAVFDHDGASLHDASLRKLEMACEKLDIGSGDRVVEIGAGWGSFALHAAQTRGCHVTTTTISRAQHDLAVERVRAAGVEHLVDVRRLDYRALRGTFDKLVSIEMVEAVGHKDFGTFFERCSKLLAPDGRMLLQAIVVDDRNYEAEKLSSSFIKSYIFPNGCLPCPRVIAECIARRTDLRMVHLEDLSRHYPETLRRWRANLAAGGTRLEELGYNEGFQRLWRLYLSFCEAGFEEGRIGVVQMVLAKPEPARRTPHRREPDPNRAMAAGSARSAT